MYNIMNYFYGSNHTPALPLPYCIVSMLYAILYYTVL